MLGVPRRTEDKAGKKPAAKTEDRKEQWIGADRKDPATTRRSDIRPVRHATRRSRAARRGGNALSGWGGDR